MAFFNNPQGFGTNQPTFNNPQAQLEQLISQGLAALKNGRFAEAKGLLLRATQAGANNASIWLALGMAARDSGDIELADQAADRSLKLEAANPRALFIKGDIYRHNGDDRSAGAHYKEGLRFCPPVDQSPEELLKDIARVNAIIQQLSQKFADHMDAAMATSLNDVQGDTSRFRESLDMLVGRRKLYLSQPHQYYFPGLPAKEFYDAAAFDWVPELEAVTDDIRSEVEQLMADKARFDAYIKDEANRPAYDTHSLQNNNDWGAFYLWHNGKPVKKNQARCPKTTAAMEKIPLVFSGRRSPNVLFSRLKPGAQIPPHTGMVNTRLICHLPLIVPADCGFRVGNDSRAWKPGKVWMFDDTVEHEAWNNSSEDRIILLFEIWKPELTEAEQKLLVEVFNAVDGYEV